MIDKYLWADSITWSRSDVPVRSFKSSPIQTTFYVTSSEAWIAGKTIDDELIDDHEKMNVTNFDEWFELVSTLWKVEFDSVDWKKSRCTCPSWVKKSICKHVIGSAIKCGAVEPPAEYNPARLKMPKKRSNQLAVKALQFQPNYNRPSKRVHLDSTTAPQTVTESVQADGGATTEFEMAIEVVEQTTSTNNVTTKHKKNPELTSKKKSNKKQLTPRSPVPLDKGKLFLVGSIQKISSCSGQQFTRDEGWSLLPPFSNPREESKCLRSYASYLHIGHGRIFMSGGLDAQTLRRVRSFGSYYFVRF